MTNRLLSLSRAIFRPSAIAHRPPAIRRASLAATFALTGVLGAAPLTLDDAIQLALQNNQALEVSRYSPQISRAGVLAAYGAFDPALTFRRTYREDETPGSLLTPLSPRGREQTDDYSLSLDGLMPWGLTYSIGGSATNYRGSFNSFADNYVTFAGVTVTQPLLRGFGFGATLANLRIAKARRDISDWQHRQTVIDTVTNVVIVYSNLQLARESARIARNFRDLAQQLVTDNETRNRIGNISDADVTEARASAATREENVLFAERTVRDLENALRQLIGETHYPLDGPPLELVELPPPPPLAIDPAADLQRAYELRPDYQASKLGIAIDRANYVFERNALLPRLDFVGSYGYGGQDAAFRTARAQVRDRDAHAYSAGVVVRIPLTFAEGRGRARAAKLTLRQSEAELELREQEIAIAVANAAGQIDTTRQRVAATRAAYELAQQSLENEQKQFTAGTSETFFVIQQQQLLQLAQSAYVRALADQRRAIAQYEREIGTTLERHGIRLE